MWTKTQIQQHIKASKLLLKIKDLAFNYIKNNNSVTEYEVQQFILKKFKAFDLKTNHPPIVAFRQSTANIHYYPKKKSKKIKQNSLIMIDLWARLNKRKAPFSDITWMAYKGKKIPREMQRVFNLIIETRDKCNKFIRQELRKGKMPVGKEINQINTDNIRNKQKEKYLTHDLGHCLGFTSPHGTRKRINKKNNDPLHKNLAYSNEPGIYLKNKFGVRSEIDFYITNEKKLVITTDVQKKITKI